MHKYTEKLKHVFPGRRALCPHSIVYTSEATSGFEYALSVSWFSQYEIPLTKQASQLISICFLPIFHVKFNVTLNCTYKDIRRISARLFISVRFVYVFKDMICIICITCIIWRIRSVRSVRCVKTATELESIASISVSLRQRLTCKWEKTSIGRRYARRPVKVLPLIKSDLCWRSFTVRRSGAIGHRGDSRADQRNHRQRNWPPLFIAAVHRRWSAYTLDFAGHHACRAFSQIYPGRWTSDFWGCCCAQDTITVVWPWWQKCLITNQLL